ncbi:hypothetical protein [uncultured Arthrobacter sp.]|uniref:hypothetical protein n=1 Tax=uncultured Arthrobacter sp. TaxID=114050 RepID=UPI0025E61446|nr:hypothetical protein [uncultured Arthrobacter sp.]
MNTEPMLELTAQWETPLCPEEVLAAVAKAFFAEKVAVDESNHESAVRRGG